MRHQLAAHEVAAVLGMDLAEARELLASAACEVERTRAALAVVETGELPDRRPPHRRQPAAARHGPAPRTRPARRRLPALPPHRRARRLRAPGPARRASPGRAARPRGAPRRPCTWRWRTPRARGAAAPRFDRRGFPMDPKDHAARRDRLRARAVTTTVVATVVAAPVLALWAAYRGAPLTGEGQDGRSVSASEATDPAPERRARGDDYENAGNARTPPEPPLHRGQPLDRRLRGGHQRRRAVQLRTGAGRLTVAAQPSGDTHADHAHRVRRRTGPLVGEHGRLLALPQPSSGTLAPGRVVHDPGLRRPRARAGRPLERTGRARPLGGVISIDGLRHAARPPDHPGPAADPRRRRPTPPALHPGPDPDPTPSARTRPRARRPARPRRRPGDPTPDRRRPAPADSIRRRPGDGGSARADAPATGPSEPPARTLTPRRAESAGCGAQQRQLRRQALLAQLRQPVVPLLAHQLRQLGPVGDVHRVARAVRRRRRRAPPVQVVAAGTPAPAVVLPDRHLQDARVVGPVDPLVRPPDRQLPADVRLRLQRLTALLERQDVQRAARAARRNRGGSGRCRSRCTAGLAFAVVVRRRPSRSPCPCRGAARCPA